MIGRLSFYVIEAACLAFLAGTGLALAGNALRRLGSPVRWQPLRTIVTLWVALLLVGIVFGETVGPEFILPYYFCGFMGVGGAALWLFSFIKAYRNRSEVPL